MAPTLFLRSTGQSLETQAQYELSRTDIAFISGGSGVALVLIGIIVGWLVRNCRHRKRIRERRKTRQAQREKLHAIDPQGGYARTYSIKTMTSDGAFSLADEKMPTTIEKPKSALRPPRPDERWKWNPPGDIENTAGGVKIPAGTGFF